MSEIVHFTCQVQLVSWAPYPELELLRSLTHPPFYYFHHGRKVLLLKKTSVRRKNRFKRIWSPRRHWSRLSTKETLSTLCRHWGPWKLVFLFCLVSLSFFAICKFVAPHSLEQEDWVTSQMKARESEFTEFQQLRICVGEKVQNIDLHFQNALVSRCLSGQSISIGLQEPTTWMGRSHWRKTSSKKS